MPTAHAAVASLLTLALALPAQDADEAAFFKEAVTKLNAYATLCQHNGFPKKAKETWLEVVAEYDTNDETARKALGYVKVGTSWANDPKFVAPSTKETPDPAVAKTLQTRWNEASGFLAAGHKKVALALKAANPQRSKYHFDRALRFNPADADAGAATGVQNHEGFFGSEAEITVLKRSRLMQRRIQELAQKAFPVEAVPQDQKEKHLVKANIPHRGWKSENFTIWGDHDADVLKEAAMNAERALAFCATAWEGVPGYPSKTGVLKEMLFLTSKQLYDQVLRAHEGQLGAKSVEFDIKNTSSCAIDSVRVSGVAESQGVQDLAVRYVVHEFSQMRSDGLREGIGHAVVGMFFGKNLTFSVAQHKPKDGFTVSGKEEDPRLLLPDLEAWAEIAAETAWQKTAMPAAQLPLIKASSFPDEGRIKSWAFCDYMLRRDPAALKELDRCMSEGTQPKVEAKFAERTSGQVLTELDEAWRHFWTDDTPLLRAVKGKVTPLEAVSKSAVEWLRAFNEVRKQLAGTVNNSTIKEVGWSSSYSGECKTHAEYLKQNPTERGPAAEQTQKAKGASNSGRNFAQMALVNTQQGKPDKIIEGWIDVPGYRDALLNPNLGTVGLYADGQIAVFEVLRGSVRRGQVVAMAYPFNGQKGVGTEVSVKDLGPEVQAALKAKGKEKLTVLGYPITYHTYSGVPKDRASITCDLKSGKDKAEGFVFVGDDGNNRRSAAPGLIVFFPYEPLKRGAEYEVTWSWDGKGGGGTSKFQTR